MKIGDYVIFQNSADDRGPYDDIGYFGVGKITKLFESTEPYFADEIEKGEIIWKKRLEFEVIKKVETKKLILRMNGGRLTISHFNKFVNQCLPCKVCLAPIGFHHWKFQKDFFEFRALDRTPRHYWNA